MEASTMVDKAGLRQPGDVKEEGAEGEGAAPAMHLPGPSVWPASLAFGVALLLFGVLTTWVFSLVGAAVFVWSLAMWVSQLRRESVEHGSAEHEMEGGSPDHDVHARVDR